MKKHVVAGVFAAVLITIPFMSAYAETFNRYLQKGDRGSDVLMLQKVLNTDADTAIARDGNGSLGRETDFYGELTKQAVIKLQKKHDLGNRYGFFTIYSGALDDKTRLFLNTRLSGTTFSATTTATSTATSTRNSERQERVNDTFRRSQISNSLPYIQSITPRSVTNGDFVTITGRNFSTTTPNTIRMMYNSVATISPDGRTLNFQVNSSLQSMFDEEAKNLKSDEKKEVKEEMGELPLFITVQNARGVSNPYQIYLKIK